MATPAWAKENSVGMFVPYTEHITSTIVKTEANDFICTLKLDGVAHESADDEDIVIWKEQLNSLWKNISAPDLCFYTHTVRRVIATYPGGSYTNEFCNQLNDKYKAHIFKTKMRVNELYVTLIYRPISSGVGKSTTGAFEKIWKGISGSLGILGVHFESDEKATKQYYIEQQFEAIEKLNEQVGIVREALKRYGPSVLSTYEENGVQCSELFEFFGYLINGEWQKYPLPKGNAAYYLPTSRLFFGAETVEIRLPDKPSRYAACLSFKEYPAVTSPGFLNAILSVPFDLVVTESFLPKSKAFALDAMQRNQRKMVNAGEVAQSLIEEIDAALDDVSAGRIVMGEHHVTLMVFADSKKELKANLATARADLVNLSIVIAREDWALEAAWWAQLPGNFKFRPRPSLVTSRNFAGLASFHNYPAGRLKHNQWGPCVTMFHTTSGTPYFFNLHKPLAHKPKEGDEQDSNKEKALGNMLMTGISGSGKTVLLNWIAAMLQKFGPTIVAFDKDRGLDNFINALGGVYLPLQKGVPSGFNPFWMENTPDSILFLESLVNKLITTKDYRPSVVEQKKISDGIKDIMRNPKEYRSLSSLMGFLDGTKLTGAYAHLKKWVKQTGDGRPGSHAWVFDNPVDTVDFNSNSYFGFDVTEFLDDDELRTPIVMYLFHKMEKIIDGRRFVCLLDEFWKLLQDEYFEDFINNKLKTIRKQNGIIIFGSQSPQDYINSKIAHTLIEQVAVQIHLGNPKATKDIYGKLGMTERECEHIREMQPRNFLIKLDVSSVIARFSLPEEFADDLAILSSTTDSVQIASRARAEYGTDPDVWIPKFHEMRKSAVSI